MLKTKTPETTASRKRLFHRKTKTNKLIFYPHKLFKKVQAGKAQNLNLQHKCKTPAKIMRAFCLSIWPAKPRSLITFSICLAAKLVLPLCADKVAQNSRAAEKLERSHLLASGPSRTPRTCSSNMRLAVILPSCV